MAAAVAAVILPAATEAMREAAVETVWRTRRRDRINQFPISDHLSALMALVMADLSESQRETLMNLIFQRDIALVEEEEIEDDALLSDKKKRKRKPQAKKKGKAQPAGSAAHECG